MKMESLETEIKKLNLSRIIAGTVTSMANFSLWSIGAIYALDCLTNTFPEKENLYWTIPSVTALGIVGLCSVEYLGETIIRKYAKKYEKPNQNLNP